MANARQDDNGARSILGISSADESTPVPIQADPTTGRLKTEATGTIDTLSGLSIPEHDEIDLTYVASGNGAGEIETATFKLDGTTKATLTLSYNADDKLIKVAKSWYV